MIVIWYNPDIDRYERGMQNDYVVTTSLSRNSDRFQVLHEFDTTETSAIIVDKLIMNLNQIRVRESSLLEIFG